MSNAHLKAAIDAFQAQGKGPKWIAEQLDCSREYVSYVINLLAPTPPAREPQPKIDHDKHLQLIAQANRGRGFPVCVKR